MLSQLFPLPLTHFETYMLADHRPEYPMVFYVRLKFTGPLNRAKFMVATATTLGRHPLLRATVRSIKGRLCWILWDGASQCTWDSEDRAESLLPVPPLDLFAVPGLRMQVSRDAEHDHVLLEFHHASCDGIAAMQFIEDLLIAYHAEHGIVEPNSPPRFALDPQSLNQRSRLGMSFWRRLRRAPLVVTTVWGLVEFFINRPMALVAPQMPAPEEVGPGLASHAFGSLQLASLRSIARSLGVTINDLLVRDLLSTVADWNTRHQPGPRPEMLRITVPVNLRELSDASLSATNVVSMIFIDRRPENFTSPTKLLRSVVRDTWLIKRFRLGLIFVWVTMWLCRCPPLMRRMLAGRHCMSTAVLSNLGVQLDNTPLPKRQGRILAGNVMLDQIEFFPPLRPFTRIAVGVVTYGGELNIAMHYDRRSLAVAAGDSLLQDFRECVASTATGRRDQCTVPSIPAHRIRYPQHS
jgi:NRPS condensation-like uncharacterized protein